MAPPQVSINHLENPIVTKLHTFETETSDWNFELSSIQNGELLLTAAEEGNSVFLNRQFEEGEGIIFLYKNDEGRDWASFFANGAEYRSQPFLNFGIYDLGYPKLDIIKGPNGFRENNIQGNFSPRLNTWYQVLMAIGENGHFLVTISDPQNPEDLLLYKEVLGSDWSGFTWNFGITINKGTLRIDDVMEISFSGVID